MTTRPVCKFLTWNISPDTRLSTSIGEIAPLGNWNVMQRYGWLVLVVWRPRHEISCFVFQMQTSPSRRDAETILVCSRENATDITQSWCPHTGPCKSLPELRVPYSDCLVRDPETICLPSRKTRQKRRAGEFQRPTMLAPVVHPYVNCDVKRRWCYPLSVRRDTDSTNSSVCPVTASNLISRHCIPYSNCVICSPTSSLPSGEKTKRA